MLFEWMVDCSRSDLMQFLLSANIIEHVLIYLGRKSFSQEHCGWHSNNL